MSEREFRILGPLEAVSNGGPVELRPGKQTAVLAMLLVNAGEVVPTDVLIEALWGESPPATAANGIQLYVSGLRKLLGRDAIATRTGGYLLQARPDEIDARRFERLVAAAGAQLAAGDPMAAATAAREALALWRGPPLADLGYEGFAQAEIARLEELHETALALRIDADLALGNGAGLVGELHGLVARHPLDERLRGQLMLALYRAGRQAEALETYQAGRTVLRDELGLEPTPALQELERAILRQEPSLEPARRAPAALQEQEQEQEPEPGPAPQREVRKTVTVVFAEAVGPPLDPEARRGLVERASGALSQVLVEAGGTVEAVPGDRVMAVFGVPVADEDDPLRAVRAAHALGAAVDAVNADLDAARGLRLAFRAGVDTGKAIAGAALSGAVVASASHLCEAAAPGEILIGAGTERLVRHAAALEAGPSAFRLVAVETDAPARTTLRDAPLVGRERELAELLRAIERVRADNRPLLFTVLGPAGIGKSRLARELETAASDRATVLASRSLPHTVGASLRPIADIVREVAGSVSADAIEELLPPGPTSRAIAEGVAAGLGAADAAGQAADTFWAVRKLLEGLARERPLVVLFDDIHWAGAAFLDLVESVVDLSRGAPILLVCLARPELFDERPGWGGGKANATSMLLLPLDDRESVRLVESRDADLDEALRSRVVETAEGNPFFLEQLLAALAEGGTGPDALELPGTIEALIAARLDRLPDDERTVLECAAVAGREFVGTAVAALARDEVEVLNRSLAGLIRRELVEPSEAGPEGGEAYRFHHVLLRETTLESIPKERRAGLHERLADWAERATEAGLGELEEAAGDHLEQAHALRRELGERDDALRPLAVRAARHLAAAGRRAYARDDILAAASLFSRSTALDTEPSPARNGLLVDLAESLREMGELGHARAIVREVIDAARASGDAMHEARARVLDTDLRWQTDPEAPLDGLAASIDAAIAELERVNDTVGLARAWTSRAWAPWLSCQAAEAERNAERAVALAREAGDARSESVAVQLLLGAGLFGPAPVAEAAARCTDVIESAPAQRRIFAAAHRALAGLRAMEGRFDEARQLLERDAEITHELGLRIAGGAAAEVAAIVEFLADDPAAAELRLRTGSEILEEYGDRGSLSNLIAMLARALVLQGRTDEALHFAKLGAEIAPRDDVSAQAYWRSALAAALASRGEVGAAEQPAREAVALTEETDFLFHRADCLAVLSEVLRAAGRAAEAAAFRERALALHELKGNTAAAARTRAGGGILAGG